MNNEIPKNILGRFVTSQKIKVAKDADGFPIFLEININLKAGPFETVNHEKIQNCLILSISGYAWNARRHDCAYAGQIYDELTDQNIKEYLIPSHKLAAIVAIWKRWHLNDLKAACIHQKDFSANDPKWHEKAAEESKKCPNGYQYGSSWLVEPLPLEIAAEITSIFNKYHD